ncbi:MAG: flagellar hook-length control protein FliK, partial [Solirubrobacteraceae bacterium]|nr:flagellar hook-length control protein FliK [Solirubrobacteraceae bacterium]
AIEALVHLSRSSGTSHARIALAPEQLGGIQVTLIFGADGVTARLIADRPEAAAALTRAGQDLKDSLQQQGIDLAGLETGFAGDGSNGASRQAAQSEASRLSAANRTSRQSDGDQTLHVAMSEQPAAQPLAPGRTIDLRA